MMDDYFRDLIDQGWLVIYMDDMLIHARTEKELENRTKQVLERLQKYDLYLKLEKCKFVAKEIDFLGMVITKDTIKMDPIKLAGIRDWPTPTTVKQVRSFLGFGNYYRRFIAGFAHLARPLHDLTKKNKIWVWTAECQAAFELLKERFTSAPVLMMPDVTKQFFLQTDASDRAIGAVLMQKDDNGDLHPCGYLSHALTPTETRWQIYDRELYAIYYALYKEWRHLLEGTELPVSIQCDHKNLTYYREPQNLTYRQARWWNDLSSRFNITLTHIPGAKLIIADALSRRPDHMSKDEPNELITMLPDKLFVRTIAEDLRDRAISITINDEFAQSIKKCLKDKGTPPLRTALSDWTLDDELIQYKGKTYIPSDVDLRRDLIKEFHESPTSGHPGFFKTLALLKEYYWWPLMSKMVKQFHL
jgi:RNase H-like domain found in reverse transcriptase/Integrase zinc binding domain/Reverse transcriptase (RNA-dependent DNA polymerase)